MTRGLLAVFPALFLGACVTLPPPPPEARAAASRPAALPPPPKADRAALPVPVPSPSEESRPAPEAPVFLAARPNLNDYVFLADGGETFGFSVGHSRSWVVRLPPAPAGPWVRAYVGAKLGAMKTERKPGRPDWDRRVAPGAIYAAVAQDVPWPQSRRFLLARTEDIPLAADPRQPLEGVGEARWFWTEIPLSILSTGTPNLVALYSPDETLKGEERSPVLSGGKAEGKAIAWWRDKAEGEPPRTSTEAFQFPSASYTPAVALKLVPARGERPVVTLRLPPDRSLGGKNRTVWAMVEGTDIESAWLEVSADGGTWIRVGRPVWGAPYFFSLSREALPRGTLQIRVAARDIWEAVGTSPAVKVKMPKGDDQ